MKKTYLIIGCLFAVIFSSSKAQSLKEMEASARAAFRVDLDSSRGIALATEEAARDSANHEMVAWALNWQGICFLRQGQADSAGKYLKECVTYCEIHDIEDVMAKAHLNQSINAHQQGDYKGSVEVGMAALAKFEETGDTLGMAHAWYNVGLSYHRMERLNTAYEYYLKALPIYQERGGVLDRANTCNAIGSIWNSRFRQDSALYYFELARDIKLAVGAWAYCGSEYSNIASAYEALKDTAEAEINYIRSYEAYMALGDIRGASLVASNISQFKYDHAEWDSAIYYGEMGLQYADNSEDRYLSSLSHLRLSEAYREVGNFERAFYHDERYDSLHEEITDADVQKNMDELHIRYQTEKREKELAEERVENQRITLWLIGSVGGIVLLITVFLYWYRQEEWKKERIRLKAIAELEAERHRISMDLHDHLGAELTMITSQLDVQAFQAEDSEMGEKLEELAEQSRLANAQLRETIWSVRSNSVSSEQFLVKVREFAQRITRGSGMAYSDQVSGIVELPSSMALNLFRVVQEAIHNAKKYSEGTKIELEFRVKSETLWLVVADNGKGMGEGEGYGLANMKERVAALQGEINWKYRNGTRVTIEVPLPN